MGSRSMNTICRCSTEPNPCENKPRFVRQDLDEKVESFFLQVVYEACQCYENQVDLCTAIKQCLDQKFGPMWHVVIGPKFGGTCEMANDYETRRSGNGTSCYGDEKPRFVRYALPTDEESNFLYLVRRVYEVNDEPEDMVKALRIRLTEDYGPTWHVIIGEGIAGHFEHDPKSFCYITYKGLSFLMFKFG